RRGPGVEVVKKIGRDPLRSELTQLRYGLTAVISRVVDDVLKNVYERIGPGLPLEVDVGELAVEVRVAQAREERTLALLHLGERFEQRLQRREVFGKGGRTFSRPALEPDQFGPHDVNERPVEGAKARRKILLPLLGCHRRGRFEDFRVGPPVVAIEKLDFVPIHRSPPAWPSPFTR